MSCAQCQGIAQEFDDRVARRELRRYRKRGPTGTTGRLVDAILAECGGAAPGTFLDVGGGVGVIQHELAAGGAPSGTHVDASPAYLSVARSEAERLGHADRVRYIEGDLVAMAGVDRGMVAGMDGAIVAGADGATAAGADEALVPPADIVTLDRVLCCYPDMPALVDASASRARRLYGVVVPREHLLMRLAAATLNLIQRLRRRPFRVFLHGMDRIDARIRRHGLRRVFHEDSLLWQIHLYRNEGDPPPGPSTPDPDSNPGPNSDSDSDPSSDFGSAPTSASA